MIWNFSPWYHRNAISRWISLATFIQHQPDDSQHTQWECMPLASNTRGGKVCNLYEYGTIMCRLWEAELYDLCRILYMKVK